MIAPQGPPSTDYGIDQRRATVAELHAKTENLLVSTQALIVEKWPSDALADLMVSMGLGGLATGSLAYYASGYPGFSLKLVPSAVSWVLGVVFLWRGLIRLRRHEDLKLNHFLQTFKVSDAQRALAEHASFGKRAVDFFRRRRPPAVQTQLDQV